MNYSTRNEDSQKKRSAAYSSDVPKAFQAMGYNPSSLVNYNFAAIKASIDAKKPVYASGHSSKKNNTYEGGHAWVIDDYRLRTVRAMTEEESNDYKTDWNLLGILDEQSYWVYCNFGWDGDSDGWYQSGIFDASQKPYLTIMRNTAKAYYYQYNQQIIPYITPKK